MQRITFVESFSSFVNACDSTIFVDENNNKKIKYAENAKTYLVEKRKEAAVAAAGRREINNGWVCDVFILLPDHEHHLQYHRIDLLRENLYRDMAVGHQVRVMDLLDHHRRKLISVLMVS